MSLTTQIKIWDVFGDSVHQIVRLLLFFGHVSNLSHSGVILELSGAGDAWFLMSCDWGLFVCRV